METVAAVAVIGGTAYSAYGQYKAGEAAEDTAAANAALLQQTANENEIIAAENLAIANREADELLKAGSDATRIKRKEIARLLAYQRTQEGVSGFAYEGTPVWLAEESAREGEEDVAMIWSNALTSSEETRARGRVAAKQGQIISGQLRSQADIQLTAGSYAASAGRIGSTSTLLQGLGNAYYRINQG